jgi:hypothetical protein
MRPRPEREHYHHRLAESSRQEEVRAALYLSRRPNPNGNHTNQIKRQHKNIRRM